jgi:hypothetical protein
MYKAADASHGLDHLSVGSDAAVIEFAKPRLLPATLPTSLTGPAYTLTARVRTVRLSGCR